METDKKVSIPVHCSPVCNVSMVAVQVMEGDHTSTFLGES